MIGLFIGLIALLAAYTFWKKQEDKKTVVASSLASVPSLNLHQPTEADKQTYLLPQVGFVEQSDWQKMTHSMFLNDEKPYLVPWYDWQGQMKAQCSANNAPIAPRTPQDCPDSSFTYVTDMNKFIPSMPKGQGGCIQLGYDAQNFCYSDSEGKYHPWWDKINASSP